MKAKQIMTTTIVGMMWILALTAPVAAQQPAPEGEQKSQSQQRGEKMSMDDMMKQCQSHYQEMTASMDRMMKGMDEAEQSNDPTQMRSALEQVQQPMAEMKDRMGTCMQMIGMMQNMPMGGMMQEGSGGQRGGMMSGQQGQQGGCCPPPRKIPAIVRITGVVLASAFVLSLIAALIALTVFLLRRSRTHPAVIT